jgi:tetratricopeptide (TPR) repeat protein
MKRTRIHAVIIAAFSILTCTAAVAAADPPAPMPPDPKEPKSLQEARGAIERGAWLQAEELLRIALMQQPQHAESHNLYAYSIRKGPQPRMDLVFRHYNEALRLRPDHRGAHEYLGEAYLMTGNVAKAKEHLAVLERLCQRSCEEYALLERAIGTAERQQATK